MLLYQRHFIRRTSNKASVIAARFLSDAATLFYCAALSNTCRKSVCSVHFWHERLAPRHASKSASVFLPSHRFSRCVRILDWLFREHAECEGILLRKWTCPWNSFQKSARGGVWRDKNLTPHMLGGANFFERPGCTACEIDWSWIVPRKQRTAKQLNWLIVHRLWFLFRIGLHDKDSNDALLI